MGAFNGGALLILLALFALLAFRRELTAWIDGPQVTALPCDLCGDMTPADAATAAPVLCARCAPVAAARKGGDLR